MNVNKKELEESLNYLTKEQQDLVIFYLQQLQLLSKIQINKDVIRVIIIIRLTIYIGLN